MLDLHHQRTAQRKVLVCPVVDHLTAIQYIHIHQRHLVLAKTKLAIHGENTKKDERKNTPKRSTDLRKANVMSEVDTNVVSKSFTILRTRNLGTE